MKNRLFSILILHRSIATRFKGLFLRWIMQSAVLLALFASGCSTTKPGNVILDMPPAPTKGTNAAVDINPMDYAQSTSISIEGRDSVPPKNHHSPNTITVGWLPSVDDNVTGYNIYFGNASRSYTNVINAGNFLTAVISNLVPGAVYCFAITAYDALGEESPYSSETVWTNPIPTMQVLTAVILDWGLSVPVTVQASSDLSVWTDSTNLTGSGCLMAFDPSATARHWRLKAAQLLTLHLTPILTNVPVQ